MSNPTVNHNFGSWSLRESTINVLLEEESHCRVDRNNDFDFSAFNIEVQQNKVQSHCQITDESASDSLNDFLELNEHTFPSEDVVIDEVKCSATIDINIEQNKEAEPVQVSLLTNKLINALKEDSTGIQEVIDIVLIVPEAKLQSSLIEAWNELQCLKDKWNLIKLLSPYRTCSSIICRDILLPELMKSDNLQSALETLVPVVECLGIHAVSDLIIPILTTEGSVLIKETVWIKDVFTSLAKPQQLHLISCCIGLLEESFDKKHLQILASVLETIQLQESEIPRLLKLFNCHLEKFNDDRHLGKILLVIVATYSLSPNKHHNKEIIQLCTNFKGVMRFRINAALKKILT